MLTISENLRKSVVECYLYANTPGYLYRRLRSLEELTDIAQETTTEDIVEQIDLLLKSLDSADQLMEIYALIVVLSYKSNPITTQAFQRFAKINLDWVGHLSLYALNMRVPSNTLSITKTTRQTPHISWDSNNTQTKTKYDYKPEITVTGG